MSYGFGIGDFVAVGDLCWKLYRNVVQVARGAPKEIQSLQQDLSNLSNVMKALQEDATQPDSAIAQASPDRVRLGKDLLARTEEVLRRLEKLAGKYELLQQPRDASAASWTSRMSRKWKKVQYAGDVRNINDCRAQAQADLNNEQILAGALHCQAYTNLLKASWILIDIIAVHPQLSFLSGSSQQLDVQHFSQVVKAEHIKLESRGFMQPSLDQVKRTDLTIWTTGKRTTLLPSLPSGPTDRTVFWRSGSDDILFGYCNSQTDNSEIECVVLLIARAGNTISVVAQAADGQDVLRADTIHHCDMDHSDGGFGVSIASNIQRPDTKFLEFSSFASASSLVPNPEESPRFAAEAIQAAIIQEDPELLVGVLRFLGCAPTASLGGRTAPGNTFVDIIHTFMEQICESAGVNIVVWVSLKLRNSSLLEAATTVGGLSFNDTLLMFRRIIEVRDGDAFKLFCKHVVGLYSEGMVQEYFSEYELARMAFTNASKLKCPEGYECSLPFIRKGTVKHGQVLLMPAVLASHADLLRVLLKHDFLHPNYDLYTPDKYWVERLERDADPDMPHWPLYFSIQLMSEPEAIECLIAAGAKLSRSTLPHGVEPKILASLRGCQCVEDARQRFLDAHFYLRKTYSNIINTMRNPMSVEWAAEEQLVVGAEFLGMEVKGESLISDYEATGVDRIPSLPRVLETEESFFSWREGVIEILEKATNSRNQQAAA
ncbi:hypothetical protein DL766_007553 [Monosporascus sp. MC13-8B]|uniref:Fungal N-terminal domain-containing protein n=1 Tax=Monosporascus cannonballus TaxID=155416 RepID=A0ABY0HNG1_9PEZI|nr:hypothetical protein DL762_000233 [Monosporascus cannonballus]RYO99375.1 hypothetical protein DL763_001549 [Monosporascus cannonballus]RYP23136.1 hypothetical protein DL766_007553 [Monosporascus sp. MC13-8B]